MSGAITGTAPCLRREAATPSPHGPPRGTRTRHPARGFAGCCGEAFMGSTLVGTTRSAAPRSDSRRAPRTRSWRGVRAVGSIRAIALPVSEHTPGPRAASGSGSAGGGHGREPRRSPQRVYRRMIAHTSAPIAAAPVTTIALVATGFSSLKARAWRTALVETCSMRRGTFAFTSMAASVALSSARAFSTGSVMPSATAVRGTGTSELISHCLHILGDRLGGVVALDHLAPAKVAEQAHDGGAQDEHDQHDEGREPRGHPRREPDDGEGAEGGDRPEEQEERSDDPSRPDPGVLRRATEPPLRGLDLRGDEVADEFGHIAEESE